MKEDRERGGKMRNGREFEERIKKFNYNAFLNKPIIKKEVDQKLS